ncbi:retrovirus-related pol polyprotein from transposon TNT 1-94 [Tanacetum coccineum]
MMLLAQAITQKFSNPTNYRLRTSSNTRNQAVIRDGIVDIQTKNAGYGRNGNKNAGRQNWNQVANVGNGQCYNCNARGHYARDCPKPKFRDAKYFREQMLIAMKDEAKGTLNDKGNDFMLDNAYEDETLEELTVAVIMMARIQPSDDNAETEPKYDAKAISEVNAQSHKWLDIQSNIIFDDPYVGNNCRTVKHAHDQSFDIESLMAKKAFKARENNYLNDKLTGLGYQNPERLKKAVAAQPKMYDGERLHSTKLIIDSPDFEETLEDAKEIRLKIKNKMIQLNYAKLNALYETFVPQKEFSAEQTYFSTPSTSNVSFESSKEISDLPTTKLSNESKLLKMFDEMDEAILALRKNIDHLKELKQELTKEVQEMLNIFESMEKKVETQSQKDNMFQNEIDLLLEASFIREIRDCVLISVAKQKSEILMLEKEKISSDSKDIQANLLKRIKILENDFKRSQAQCIDFELKLQHQNEKMACDVCWKSKLTKLSDENMLLKTQVDSVVQERENIKLEYQKLFNSIKATRVQHQRKFNELIENVNQNTYAYGDVRSQNQDLLMKISELKDKIKTIEKGKNVTLKSSNSVRRPQSKDNKSKKRVLKNINVKSTSTNVRKFSSSDNIVSNKLESMNSTVCQSNANVLKAKTINVVNDGSNIVCVSCVGSKHITGNLQLLRNFVEKFIGKVRFGNDHFAVITGYGDYVQGNLMICHNLEGEDLLTGSRDSNLCTISISELAASSPLGITHNTSTVRTPQQNGVIERRNHTLVKAARTMLISSKTLGFLWAKAIATTCSTQNHSLVHTRYNKTPYELIKGRNPNVQYFHVFGSLCYLTNDHDDLGKMKPKADIGIFIGYSESSIRFCIYNRGTKKIMETIHVRFDELTTMAFECNNSGSGFNCLNFQDSLEDSQSVSSKEDSDNLFGPLYEEHYAMSTPEESDDSVANTLLNEYTPSSSSIVIEEDEVPQIVSSLEEPIANVATTPITNENANEPIQEDVAAFDENDFYNLFHSLVLEETESSSTFQYPLNMHEFYQTRHSTDKWTKNHPIEQVIGDPSKPIMTRRRLHTDAEMCMYALTGFIGVVVFLDPSLLDRAEWLVLDAIKPVMGFFLAACW